jgi:uncharacterized protein (DUF58 family)
MLRPIGVLILAGICFLAAQGTGITIFFHLFYLMMAMLVCSYLWAWLNLRGLRVFRETQTTRTQVGEVAQERIMVENTWPVAKLWVELRDHSDLPDHGTGFVSYLPPRSKRRWIMHTRCTVRGKYTLGPTSLFSGDPFGIFRLKRDVPGTSEILVYPPTTALPAFSLPSAELPGGQDVRSRTFQVTPNVATIRDYQPGDSFNRIHWRSTARLNKLIVKEFELDPTAEFFLVVDMQERVQQQLEVHGQRLFDGRSLESTEEYTIYAAASLARFLLERNRSTGLIAWGQQRELIPAERESRQLFKILETLAVLRARGLQPLDEVLTAESGRFGRNCTLLIVTSSVDARWVAALQQLVYRGVRATVVLVDPQSFGGWNSLQPVQERLAELRVPYYMFRQGQTLEEALRHPYAVDVAAVNGS